MGDRFIIRSDATEDSYSHEVRIEYLYRDEEGVETHGSNHPQSTLPASRSSP